MLNKSITLDLGYMTRSHDNQKGKLVIEIVGMENLKNSFVKNER
jgi:hypothetical protein